MPCDKRKIIEDDVPAVSENEQPKGEQKKMSSTLVMRRMPEFEMEAYDASAGKYTTVSSEALKGKWAVVCFYPADFTFVCPTEIAAMNASLDKLNELGVTVLPVSGDTKFSHKRFVETEPLLKDCKLTLGADNTGNVARKFGVWIEQEGVALRGRFIIDPEGIVVAEETVADSVGRNVNELIRQIEAWQHAYATGEVCPANWRKGKKTLPVKTDIENLTGNVGKYITIEEILA
jgi:peroxiredoxin (alkyl hydroperoxide reductase subunit C)